MSHPNPEITTLEPIQAAVVRRRVPMSELRTFFDSVFGTVVAAVQQQQVAVTGPPFAMYFGMPTDTVDVAAGFPTAGRISPSAESVVPFELAGGCAVRFLHVGSYDDLGEAYARMTAWMGEQGLTPADAMWESYLTEPTPDGDPAANQTLITWPVRD